MYGIVSSSYGHCSLCDTCAGVLVLTSFDHPSDACGAGLWGFGRVMRTQRPSDNAHEQERQVLHH